MIRYGMRATTRDCPYGYHPNGDATDMVNRKKMV